MARMVEKDLLTKQKMQKGGRYLGRYLALLEDYGNTAKACRELGKSRLSWS